jgi:quercetin dioxygenase-like cupin family protein
VEIRRFGPGNRRTEREAGAIGVTSALLHAGGSAHITEIALSDHAALGPVRSPNDGLLIVIEGGGWLALADERQRVASGEAVALPAGVERLLATDGVPLRAILVEFASTHALEQGVGE